MEFIETLNTDNVLRIIESSNLKTIRNLCLSSQQFRDWCQTDEVQNIIRRKEAIPRQRAIQTLLDYFKFVLDQEWYVLFVHLPDGTDYMFQYENKGEVYYTRDERSSKMNKSEYQAIIQTAIEKNYPIEIQFNEFVLNDPKEREKIRARMGFGPKVDIEFINNSGVHFTEGTSPNVINYWIEIIPHDFIRHYVYKHGSDKNYDQTSYITLSKIYR